MKVGVVKVLVAVVMMAVVATGCSTGTQNKGNTATPSTTASPSAAATGAVTEDQAKAIALQDAGVAETDVTAMQVRKEIDDGIEQYDIEFYTKDREYDYEIEVATGKILKKDNEIEGRHPGSGAAVVSEADAKAMALGKVPGATESNLRMSLDREDNAYEGEIIYNSREYEFKIDAQTGNFIEWQEEAAHD